MQYKIPVQIENSDKIIFNLSLKQLTIIMIGGGMAYSYFKAMSPKMGTELALIPAGLILAIAIVIAVFKSYEMTFIPFILALLRMNINPKKRFWQKGVDSFQPIEVGYVTNSDIKTEEKIDFKSKMDKIHEINEKLKKI